VIWVVGAQKVVKTTGERIRRIYEHSFPLEDQRAQQVHGMRSGVNKILIMNREINPGQTTLILAKEEPGF